MEKVGGGLPATGSERVATFARLVGQVEAMVLGAGDPAGFDAAGWVARWLMEPLPALGGMRPGELMDTVGGEGVSFLGAGAGAEPGLLLRWVGSWGGV